MFSSAFATLLASTPERPILGDLVTAVKKVEWKDLKPILLTLNVPLNKIDEVERRHPGNEIDRKTRALDCWLNLDPGATWDKFIGAASDVDCFLGIHIAGERPYRRPTQPPQAAAQPPCRSAGPFPNGASSAVAIGSFSGDFSDHSTYVPATAKPKLTDTPTLAQLRKLKVPGGPTLCIIREVAGKWEDIAIAMDFDPVGRTQTAINKDFHTVEEKCTETFKKWLQGHSKRGPATWKKLVDILKDCEFAPLASEIKTALR